MVGSVIAILHCVNQVIAYNDIMLQINKRATMDINLCLPIYTVFNLWIGNDHSSKYAPIFFSLLPLLSVFPYSWSYYHEMNAHWITKKINNKNCYLSKFIAVFISSGLVILIPLFINFVGMLLFIPAVTPDSVYDIYYNFFSNEFLANLFYTSPFIYVLLFMGFNFVFCGFFGCLSLFFSTIVKKKILTILFPVCLLIFFEVIEEYFLSSLTVEISPLSFLYPVNSKNANMIIIFTEIVILFLVTLVMPITRGNKNET